MFIGAIDRVSVVRFGGASGRCMSVTLSMLGVRAASPDLTLPQGWGIERAVRLAPCPWTPGAVPARASAPATISTEPTAIRGRVDMRGPSVPTGYPCFVDLDATLSFPDGDEVMRAVGVPVRGDSSCR